MSRPRLPRILIAFFLAVPLAASTLEHQMHEVERIRGLSFVHGVKVVNVTRATLPEYMRDQITKSLPYSFDDYVMALRTLGFIDRESGDLQQRLVDLLQQQVLAFYDPLTHTYYALDKPPSGLPAAAAQLPLEDAVAVHELTHALQDQRFNIGTKDNATRNDWDENLALHALIEGEASLVMLAELVEPFGQKVGDIAANDTLLQAMGGAATLMRATDSATPRYFIDSLAFPYVSGLQFVVAAYRRGGWSAVNRIYDDPPRSTREILHPDEYFAGRRSPNVLASAPALRPAGLLSVEHLGEWHWGFLVGPENARGWTGDRVSIVQDAFCQPTVLVETQWETAERARAFRAAYEGFLRGRHIDARTILRGSSVNAAYGADYALIERFISR